MLGVGAMASVYEVVSMETKLKFAIKVVERSFVTNAESKEQFLHEVMIHR